MRTIQLMFLPVTLVLGVGACGGDAGGEEEARTAAPVPIWRPDSTAPPVVPDDSAALIAESTAGTDRQPPAAPVNPPAAAGGTSSAAPPPESAAEGSATAPPAAPVGEAEEILLRAERAYDAVRTLRANFVQDLTVPLLDSTQRSRGELFHHKPDRFLMRFSDPAGDLVVADGRHLWLFYPSTDAKQVVRTSMGQAGRLDLQREFLSNPTERFRATLDGPDAVDGRPAKVLTLVPRGESPYRRVRIWIDDADSLARRFEITENNGNVRLVELSDLRVNSTLPDELFVFTPPPGTQVFDQ